ncbi:hypothetical protein A8G17_40100 [Escherichia coli]|nr:hypothetical protein A8G17_40100 [Escherichia coli]
MRLKQNVVPHQQSNHSWFTRQPLLQDGQLKKNYQIPFKILMAISHIIMEIMNQKMFLCIKH